MSGPRTTVLRRPFGGQERAFQLRFGEIAELERECEAGIGEIAVRLASHRFRLADIRATIRLGLEGRGMPEPQATRLVMRYVDDAPLSEHLQLAADIVSATLAGVEPEPDPKKEPAEGSDQPPATSPPSTAPAA